MQNKFSTSKSLIVLIGSGSLLLLVSFIFLTPSLLSLVIGMLVISTGGFILILSISAIRAIWGFVGERQLFFYQDNIAFQTFYVVAEAVNQLFYIPFVKFLGADTPWKRTGDFLALIYLFYARWYLFALMVNPYKGTNLLSTLKGVVTICGLVKNTVSLQTVMGKWQFDRYFKRKQTSLHKIHLYSLIKEKKWKVDRTRLIPTLVLMANCVEMGRNKQAVNWLKTTFLAIQPISRIQISHHDLSPIEPDSDIQMLSDALLSAIGACSSRIIQPETLGHVHDELNNFQEKTIRFQELMKSKLYSLIKIRKDVYKYDQYREIEAFVSSNINSQSDAMSPASILFMVVNDTQNFTDFVRQGAVSGFRHLLKAPELDGTLKKNISEKLSDNEYSLQAIHMRTRYLLLPQNCDYNLMHYYIKRAVHWMENGRDQSDAFNDLIKTIKILNTEVPGIINFLTEYPLRLMKSEDNQWVHAYFKERLGYDLQLWIRYVGIIDDNENGTVISRYLDFKDQTRPNSMGINYRLFLNPVIVSSIIYHEYLHYKGHAGEGDVFFREMLFFRSLVARFAPSDNRKLAEYEKGIVHELQKYNLTEYLYPLTVDMEDESFAHYLNDMIIELYDVPVQIEEAISISSEEIAKWEQYISFANHNTKWCPQIKWPSLARAKNIREQIQSVILKKVTQVHCITLKELDIVLKEEICQKQIAIWQDYTRRRGACMGFEKSYYDFYSNTL